MQPESVSVEKGRLKNVPRSIVFSTTLLLTAVAVYSLVRSAREIALNDYLELGYVRPILSVAHRELVEQTVSTLVWLAPAALLVSLLLVTAANCCSAFAWGGTVAGQAALLLAGTFFLSFGYEVNRFEFGLHWKTLSRSLGIPLPEALFMGRVLLANAAIVVGSVVVGGLGFLLANWPSFFRRVSRISSVAIALVPLLLLSGGRVFLASTTPAEGPNLLLISVDTFRGDRLGAMRNGESLTPHLDALAKDGALFRNAYSTSSWTLPSMASVMTGMPPSQHGAIDYNRPFSEDKTTLAEVLQAQGYGTGAVVFSAYVQPDFGFGQGFDSFQHFGKSMRRTEVSSDKIADLGVEWLERNGDRPFFLFLHFFDPHYNYVDQGDVDWEGYEGPIENNHDIYDLREIQDSLGPEDVAMIEKIYDDEVRFTDHHIGRVLTALKRLDLEKDTIVVLTSDHGEEFFEHDWIGHVMNLYEGMIHVPLIIRAPGKIEPCEIETPVTNDRIPATALGLLSREIPEGTFPGGSLLPLVKGGEGSRIDEDPLFASVFFSREDKRAMKRSVRKGKWKLVYDYDWEKYELYDLEKDAREQSDLFSAGSGPSQELKAILETWSAVMDEFRGVDTAGSGTRKLDPKTEERLREMGYIE